LANPHHKPSKLQILKHQLESEGKHAEAAALRTRTGLPVHSASREQLKKWGYLRDENENPNEIVNE